MNSSILQLMPQFTTAAHRLHDFLVGAAFVLCLAGLLSIVIRAQGERSTGSVWPSLVRLAVIAFLVGSLSTWADTLAGAANDVLSQLGLNTMEGGIFTAYRNAVAQKFGSDGAGQQASTAPQGTTPPASYTGAGNNAQLGGLLAGNEANFQAAGAANGVDPLFLEAVAIEETGNGTSHALQAYNNPAGLMDPSTPNDTGFFQYATLQDGINAEAANLQKNYISQGLTTISDIGAKYAPSGALNDPNGTNGNWGNDVAGIYQSLGGTSMQVGSAQSTTTGNNSILGGWISKIGDSLTVALLFPLVHLLSLIALGCMWIMQAVQQILYIVEIAVSPIFLGLFMIPRLAGIAVKFFLFLASLCLWALGWVVADLLTQALINLAVNPTNNAALSAFSGTSMLLGYWVVLALWVIGSSFFAPVIVSGMLLSGSSGIAALFGATVGAVAGSAVGGAGSLAATAATGAVAAPISAASNAAMSTYSNFARRPKSAPAATEV
jgi:Mannosyl-glycoprotein endo-beta-N-acetylglucosaminidase